MAFDFPNSPTVGQKYPQPAVAGQPVYNWDGAKWTTIGGAIGGKQNVYTDGSQAMIGQLTVVDPPVGVASATSKNYVDTGDAAAAANQLKYTAQSLTAPQQVQARQNIYAAPFDAMAFNGMQINGDCIVNQERAVGQVITTGGYVSDVWTFIYVAAGASLQGYAVPSLALGFTNMAVIQTITPKSSLSAGDYVGFQQRYEGYRISRLAWGTANAQPITLAFWTAHNRTGLYSIAIGNGASNRCYVASYMQNVANTPEYKTITVPGDTAGVWTTDNSMGLIVTFANAIGATYTAPSFGGWGSTMYFAGPGQVNGVAASTDFFRVTGLVVLPGSDAPSAARSPLIMRPYDQELLLCRRHWKRFDQFLISGYAGAGGSIYNSLTLDPPMRAPPVGTITGGSLSNASGATVYTPPGSTTSVLVYTNAVAAGSAYIYADIKLDARL